MSIWLADYKPLRASTLCLISAVRGFHSKLSCRAARGSTTHESQDCSVPAALSQSCPKVCLRSTSVGAKRVSQARSAGLSAAYGRSTLAPVVARRVVYTPFRSLLDKRHRRLATQARSNRPHTLGLSNVQIQGQVNLPLRLPT